MATAAQMDKAVDLAEAENGYGETPVNITKFGAWYGMNGSAWCAMFVSWCYWNAGAPQPASTAKGFAYTPSGAAWYQANKAWAGPSSNPERGWVVFFYSVSAGRIAHVGLVRGPRGDDGMVPTVEGNTNVAGGAEGGGVYLKRRDPSQGLSFRIAGYGIPGETTATVEEWYEMPMPDDVKADIRREVWVALNNPPPSDIEAKGGSVANRVAYLNPKMDTSLANQKTGLANQGVALENQQLFIAVLPDITGGGGSMTDEQVAATADAIATQLREAGLPDAVLAALVRELTD